jgi:hypothetical protein
LIRQVVPSSSNLTSPLTLPTSFFPEQGFPFGPNSQYPLRIDDEQDD